MVIVDCEVRDSLIRTVALPSPPLLRLPSYDVVGDSTVNCVLTETHYLNVYSKKDGIVLIKRQQGSQDFVHNIILCLVKSTMLSEFIT